MEIQVKTNDHQYNIYIDSWMDKLPQILKSFKLSKNALLITDKNVDCLYTKDIIELFSECELKLNKFVVDPGEDAKSLLVAERAFTAAVEAELDRKSLIIALGGGVVGDLAGFVAANYLRGIPFIQVPTSLLAQVDSSVGGKVAVNHPLGKNLIGAFYQPQAVLAATKFLHTLPDREFSTGMAEVIKYGVILNQDFFNYLLLNQEAIMKQDSRIMANIIYKACCMKASIVEQDEKETSLRMILNFGHTVGHAVEAATNFNRYTHGEAVAIGMHAAARISQILGLCSEKAVHSVVNCILKFNLPVQTNCTIESLIPYLKRDKKSIGGAINWVLMREIGNVDIYRDVSEETIIKALQTICTN